MFTINEQQLTNLIAPITPFYGTPTEWLQLEEGTLTTMSEIYRRQGAVRSVIDFFSGHAARMPIKLFQQNDDGDRVHLRKHPAQKIINVPSAYQGKGNFWREMWQDLLIYDRVCAVKLRDKNNDNMPFQLVRIPPVWFTPYGQNYWHPDAIRIIGNRGMAEFPIEDCIYIHGYDPTDPRVGVSPMETLRSILEEEWAGQQWRRHFWEHGAQPSMIITRPNDAPDWEESAKDRFIVALQAAANRGRPLVLEEGMTTNPAGAFNPQTTQYVESKEFTREEVLRVYNMPLGLFDPQIANLQIGQYRSMLYAECLAPPLGRFVDELELQLLTEWSDDPYDEGYYYEAMIEEKMRGNIVEQIASFSTAVGAPFMLREEVREFLNLRKLPSDQKADELVVPMNVTVGGQASPTDATPNTLANQNGPAKPPTEFEQPPSHTAGGKSRTKKLDPRRGSQLMRAKGRHREKAVEILTKFATRQRSAVLSKKGAGVKTAFDTNRWNKELKGDLMRLGILTAGYFGTDAAESIGGSYDEDRTLAWLDNHAEIAAAGINDVTEKALAAAGADATLIFASLLDARVPQQAETWTTDMANFGVHEAAQQNGVTQKQWNVMSENPRPSHAEMDGETVDVGTAFSNGLMYPGDPAGGVDETAGCTCLLSIAEPGGGESESDSGDEGAKTSVTPDSERRLLDALIEMAKSGRQPATSTPGLHDVIVNVDVPDIRVPEVKVNPTFEVVMPEPVVNVEAPNVEVHLPEMKTIVQVPEQAAPIVQVEVPEQPTPIVQVEAPKPRKVRAVRDKKTGQIIGSEEVEDFDHE